MAGAGRDEADFFTGAVRHHERVISAKHQHPADGVDGTDGAAVAGPAPDDDPNPGTDPDPGPEDEQASGAGPIADAVTVELDDAALLVARAAAVDEAGGPDLVGDAVDVYAEDLVAVTARFQALLDGYRGWLWSVTIALLDAGHPTVSEVVLLPGPDALMAPAWVPWEQRIRSGDLGVGDLLPPAPDDARLVPAYLQSDDPAVEEVSQELGIGRVRVLSRQGRDEAAERWHEGAFGPDDDMAVHAPGHCVTCAFYLPLAGSLGQGFGACGNEFSPADGRVVDAGYGCGAHSEAISTRPARSATTDTVVDELRLEVHARAAERSDGEDPGAGTVDVSDDRADVGDAGDDRDDGPPDPGDADGLPSGDRADVPVGDDGPDVGVAGDAGDDGPRDPGQQRE